MGAIALVGGAFLGAGGGAALTGIATGFSFGAFGLGLLPLLGNEFGGSKGVRVETPEVARSDYGASIPRLWGKHITIGNTVWAAPNGRRDQQHGSFGTPKVTETTFYGTWLTLHAAGPAPGKVMRLNRLWALQGQTRILLHDASAAPPAFPPPPSGKKYPQPADQEIGYIITYDETTGMGTGYWGGSPSDGTMRVYTGTDNQTVFPEIEAVTGVGNAQAYVNRAGILLVNFPLGGFGNQLPPIEAEWIEETTTVAGLATDIATLLQNDDSDFTAASDCDFSALDDDEFIGFKIDQRREAKTEFEQIQRVFYTDFIDLDGQIKAIKRGGSSIATLTDDDLAYHDLGAEMPAALERSINRKDSIPDQVDVAFYDDDRDGKPSTQPASRLTERTDNKTEIATSFRMNSNQARAVGEVFLAEQWIAGREPVQGVTSWRKMHLSPTDVVTIERDGGSEQFLLAGQHIRLFGPLDLSLQRYASLIYTQDWSTGAPAAPLPGAATPPTAAPLYVLFESVALHDGDTSAPGFYFVATQPNGTSWASYRFTETSLTATINSALQPNSIPRLSRGTFGTAVDVLPDWADGSSFLQDDVTVRVDLDFGTLVSVDENDMLAGANTLVWGSTANGWEVLACTQAVAIAGASGTKQRYELSGLFWRGKRGSESFIGTHQVGDKVVLINGAVERINIAPAQLNLAKSYALRYSTAFPTKGSLTTMTHTTKGVSLEPLSVADIEVESSRDGSNNVTIAFIKRSRFDDAYFLTGQDPPNAPYDLNLFEIDIMDGASVAGTVSTSNTSYVLTAAAQTALGLVPGDPVTVRVAQMSSLVGRGFVAEATIE